MSVTIKRRGLLLVLSSPSGAGKTSITRALLKNNPDLQVSVSVTTRACRPGEVEGVDYFYRSVSEFQSMIERGEFLEHAKVFGNYYGTPLQRVKDALADSQDIIFDIDWQGTQQMKQNLEHDVVTIFVLPPNRGELERRLRARQQDDESVIIERMKKASSEMSHFPEYDYVIVNYDLETSIRQAQAILDAERSKRRRLIGLSDFVYGLMDEDAN